MDKYIEILLNEANKSLKTDDVPVAAIITSKGKIIAKSHNTREKEKNAIRHAEINVIEKACKKKKTWYLDDCEIYITLEPCKMCMGAIEQARIRKIYYLTKREKDSNFKIEKIYLKENNKSREMLKTFFENKRK